ncbi:MAG: protein kinase [Victivallales bacterium]|nr:protein kinase [Victivallales bacterium]
MEFPKQKYGLDLLERCGSGGYGEVYRCRDASGKELALKIVSKTKIGSEWKRELKGITFYRQLAENIPGLLTLYHIGEDEEAFYYTMELADALPNQSDYQADTLAARLATGQLPPEQLIPVLTTILEGIRTLHDAGLAHRDIKPENILFVKGQPKLADLGLLSPLTGTMTQLVGTLDFLPPEERRGDTPVNKESRQRNDLYAFGKIIYCCITGNGANAYPSMPKDTPLTLQNKLFFRLAVQLCDQEPTKRLSSLPQLLADFQRTVHLCQYGESTWDKLRYAFEQTQRNLSSMVVRSSRFCRRHWIASILGFAVLLAASLWLAHVLANRLDSSTEELAQTLQNQKKIVQQTNFDKRDFTFYDGRYSVAVPTEWQTIDHQKILEARLPGDIFAQRLHGLLVSKEPGSNRNTVVALMILPVTAKQLSALNDQKKIQTLKPLFADDMEAVSIRQFPNPRLHLDTILLLGEAQPSKSVVCYLYPQTDHTLAMMALIPKEKFQSDMGTFLAITDSLSWKSQKSTQE